MNSFLQETDPRSIDKCYVSIDLIKNIGSDSTFGGLDFTEYELSWHAWPPLYCAREVARRIPDNRIAAAANDLLSHIEKLGLELRRAGINLDNVPVLNAFITENDSLLFEWILEDFRVGFTVERDERESCWYVVTKERLGSIRASGYTYGVDIQKMVGWIFHFMLINT
jgi:hypothetical protein